MIDVVRVEATQEQEHILQQMLARQEPANEPQHDPAIESGALMSAPMLPGEGEGTSTPWMGG